MCFFYIRSEIRGKPLTAQLQLGRGLDLLPLVGHETLVHALVLFLHLFNKQSRRIGEHLYDGEQLGIVRCIDSENGVDVDCLKKNTAY